MKFIEVKTLQKHQVFLIGCLIFLLSAGGRRIPQAPVTNTPSHTPSSPSTPTQKAPSTSIKKVPTAPAASTPAKKVKPKFICAIYNDELTTIAKTKQGDIPIVIWNSERFSAAGFTPKVRCQQVSARFETLYQSGQLKHITAGKLNKMPAICATRESGGECTRANILYTLKSNEDTDSKVMMIRNREVTARVMEK
jgi:Circadian oscillating protein COP23